MAFKVLGPNIQAPIDICINLDLLNLEDYLLTINPS